MSAIWLKKKFILGFLAALVILPVALMWPTTPKIAVNPPAYDFGEILKDGGTVETTFTFVNQTDAPLAINRLSTSCGCTTATMDTRPMAAGELREIKVVFDPMAHPDEFGLIERVVYLQTSDPNKPEIEINITGNVVKEASAQVDEYTGKAIVFFNEACKDCGELVKNDLPFLFAEYNYDIEFRDYVNERKNRSLLNEYKQEWQVPFELQSHIEAFVGDKLLIGGHLPEPILHTLLTSPDTYDRLLVYQDEMHGNPKFYKAWDFKGEIKTYRIDEPIETYLAEIKNTLTANKKPLLSERSFSTFFGLVTASAFLDGLNPCAFAVLLFFIGYLYMIKRTKASIWKMGIVYIAAIYLAYFLIGIGLAQAFVIAGAPHLMAKIGAYLVIILGVIQLTGVWFPQFPIRLRIPVDTKATLEKWLYKATLPASFIGGFIVGLCTFPCSGGIYVAIIGLLTSTQTYLSGLGWMVWYNLIFVSPLIILLLLASSRNATDHLYKWERSTAKMTKILVGLTMIALGLTILIFFT